MAGERGVRDVRALRMTRGAGVVDDLGEMSFRLIPSSVRRCRPECRSVVRSVYYARHMPRQKGTPMPKTLFTVGWVLLLLMAAALTLLSINSTYLPLAARPDGVTSSVTIDDIGAKTSPEVATALRGRRVTAATWALAYALMLWGVLLVPYKRGERWAWWAILLSLVVSQLLSLARIPMLDTQQGAGASAILLGIALVGLLLGARHVFGKRDSQGGLRTCRVRWKSGT